VHAPCEKKSYGSKDSFYDDLERVFYYFSNCHIKILLEDLMQKWGERIFSNLQLGMRVYIRIVMVMVLE